MTSRATSAAAGESPRNARELPERHRAQGGDVLLERALRSDAGQRRAGDTARDADQTQRLVGDGIGAHAEREDERRGRGAMRGRHDVGAAVFSRQRHHRRATVRDAREDRLTAQVLADDQTHPERVGAGRAPRRERAGDAILVALQIQRIDELGDAAQALHVGSEPAEEAAQRRCLIGPRVRVLGDLAARAGNREHGVRQHDGAANRHEHLVHRYPAHHQRRGAGHAPEERALVGRRDLDMSARDSAIGEHEVGRAAATHQLRCCRVEDDTRADIGTCRDDENERRGHRRHQARIGAKNTRRSYRKPR